MSSTLNRFKAILADALVSIPEPVTMDSRLLEDIGADSLDMIDVQLVVEEEFGLSVPDDEMDGLLTVGDWVNYIDAHAK